MGYYDDPIVDENAKRSEESVNAVSHCASSTNKRLVAHGIGI